MRHGLEGRESALLEAGGGSARRATAEARGSDRTRSRLWSPDFILAGGLSIKTETIRLRPPSSLEEARVLVATYVAHYDNRRLRSAIGYVTPKDQLKGRHEAIQAARLQRLEIAREMRAQLRQPARLATCQPPTLALAALP